MTTYDFMSMAQQCAPAVAPQTLAAIVRTESGFNPYAIGVVHGRLARQPRREDEAVATVNALQAAGWNYSAGLTQINRANWLRYGLTTRTVFDVCRNLAVGAAILRTCFVRARVIHVDPQGALRAALSCYASGDFVTGFRAGYVQRVAQSAASDGVTVPALTTAAKPIPVIPERVAGSRPATPRRPTPMHPTPPTSYGDAVRGQNDSEADDSAVIF
ncbi:MAG: lytic transglycosylase domain-containing protein [Burkholderia sp.]|uniref:lytic transglycosylase domain-containing protein n=1 Tax=Burkholderia sp. TaxID=36773 RepID=UPI00258CCADC|nr:lytic transglycosylase domain-containing protein [Burkholderia sp.]MCA3779121.1 lytic transglycosylase domain-containing protein [Burkholderia sp.]MCA3788708.1 lytic transglycosylase domain-containing protein [Burkholderia sp.]MCA3797159.1 lytic transglycosylase domain-containing protein [Burkholderia sp.]MCA3806258.1 lytic transglycosylase domain-containing protein [Burkholderia sp.]MCA3812091.1 lytic transglycosylase domain-containing protein [Burkholderia sp.]